MPTLWQTRLSKAVTFSLLFESIYLLLSNSHGAHYATRP